MSRPGPRETLVDADRRAGGRAELRLGSGVVEREPQAVAAYVVQRDGYGWYWDVDR